MRVTLGMLTLCAFACVAGTGGTDAGDDAGTTADAGTSDAGTSTLVVYPFDATVHPGATGEVEAFLTSPSGSWSLSLEGSAPGIMVSLAREVLDETRPRTRVFYDVASDAPVGAATFTVRATRGATTLEGTLSLYVRDPASDEHGFALYARGEQPFVEAGGAARFRVRAVSHGGFDGDVFLAFEHAGASGLRASRDVVRVAPGAVGEVEVTVDVRPQLVLDGDAEEVALVVRGQARDPAAPPVVLTAKMPVVNGGPAFVVEPAARLLVLPGGSSPFAPRAYRNGVDGPVGATFELVSPPAGVTFEAGVLRVAEGVAPGAYDLDVLARHEGVEAHGGTRLVVVAAPQGWTMTGGLAPRDVGARAVVVDTRGLVVDVYGTSQLRLLGDAWTEFVPGQGVAFDSAVERREVRVEAASKPPTIHFIWQVAGGPRLGGALAGYSGFTGATVAVDVHQAPWIAFPGWEGELHVLRYSTAGTVPANEGLPLTRGARPLIAAQGDTLALVIVQASGVTAWTRNQTQWVAAPALEATLSSAAQAALDVDASGRPVFAWIGADEQLHVTRLEGSAWVEQGAFAAGGGRIPVALSLAAASDVVLAWQESESPFGPLPGTRPGRSAVRVVRGAAGAWRDLGVAGFDPAGTQGVPRVTIDPSNHVVLAYSEDGRLAVLRSR